MRLRQFLLAPLALFPLACHSAEEPDAMTSQVPPPDQPSVANVIFRSLDVGSQSGIAELRTVTLHSAQRMRGLWKEHVARKLPAPEPPADIDWEQDMVICVTLGQRPTAGYAVQIDRVEAADGTLTVFCSETKPAPDTVQAQVTTTPYHIVSLKAFDGPVEFRIK